MNYFLTVMTTSSSRSRNISSSHNKPGLRRLGLRHVGVVIVIVGSVPVFHHLL